MRKQRKYRRRIVSVVGTGAIGRFELRLDCGHSRIYRRAHIPKRWVYCDDCYARRPGIGPT